MPNNTPTQENWGKPNSRTSNPSAAPLTRPRSTTFPARLFKSACSSNVWRLEMLAERRSRLASAGILLSTSSRSSARFSPASRSGVFCTLESRSRRRRALELRSSSREAMTNTPSATTTNTAMAISMNIRSVKNLLRLLDLHPRVEQRGTQTATRSGQAVGKLWPNPGRAKRAAHLSVFINPHPLEHENVLHADHVAFHASHFRDGHYFTSAVREACDLDHSVNRGRDLLPHRSLRDIQIGHGTHVLNAAQRIPLGVGVHRGQRTLVTSVHGLQHVKGFCAANLTHHDAVGTHTQAVDDQLPLAY